jgi:hypothetical protein
MRDSAARFNITHALRMFEVFRARTARRATKASRRRAETLSSRRALRGASLHAVFAVMQHAAAACGARVLWFPPITISELRPSCFYLPFTYSEDQKTPTHTMFNTDRPELQWDRDALTPSAWHSTTPKEVSWT